MLVNAYNRNFWICFLIQIFYLGFRCCSKRKRSFGKRIFVFIFKSNRFWIRNNWINNFKLSFWVFIKSSLCNISKTKKCMSRSISQLNYQYRHEGGKMIQPYITSIAFVRACWFKLDSFLVSQWHPPHLILM